MKILFVASEALPFIKTGGLADVCGTLPLALNKLGEDTRLIIPAYPAALGRCPTINEIAKFDLLGAEKPIRIFEAVTDQQLHVYLVDAPDFFNRSGNPYLDTEGNNWSDNAARFCLFSRAVVAFSLGYSKSSWTPDIVHCHDWQTGLVPALLSLQQQSPPSLFTVHNLAYQGLFSQQEFKKLQLPKQLWSTDSLEFYNKMSFIKGGLVYANKISTVSETYKREICTTEYGCGLEGVLQQRIEDLVGIINGADYSVWNPAGDRYITAPYSMANYVDKKPANKKFLQQHLQLSVDAKIPIIAMTGRLVIQKGIDMVIESLPQLMQKNVQLVILGTGEKRFEKSLTKAQETYTNKIGLKIGYSEEFAHQILAGSDMFLMPSRYEPCGLSQMYSMRYGSIPIVRKTGGLADTIKNTTFARLEENTATGFSFKQPTPESLIKTIFRALELYADPPQWRKLMRNAMQQNFSWQASAEKYYSLYKQMSA